MASDTPEATLMTTIEIRVQGHDSKGQRIVGSTVLDPSQIAQLKFPEQDIYQAYLTTKNVFNEALRTQEEYYAQKLTERLPSGP